MLPEYTEIGDYICWLRPIPFTNPVTITDNKLRLYYACEEQKTGRIISRDLTIDFTDEMRDRISSKLIDFIESEG